MIVPEREGRENRALGPEMTAEGWMSIGDWLLWMHAPSHRSISVQDYRWNQTSGYPAFPAPPEDPATEGWVVLCRVHDEHGNPFGEWTGFWVQSFGEATRRARLLRASIMAEYPEPVPNRQLTLDDAMASPRQSDGPEKGNGT